MALHTKKEFALLCGFINAKGEGDTKKLSTYHGRKKLVYSGDYVDDSILLNQTFLTEMAAKEKTAAKNHKPPNEEKKLRLTRPLNKKEIMAETESLEKEVPNTSDTDFDNESFGNYQNKVLEKKTLEVEKLKEEIRKLKLGNNKTQGDYVAIDMVKNLIVIHTESLKESYEHGMQDFIVKFASQNSLPREEIFKMKEQVFETINSTMQKAIDNTKRALRRLQSELSNKKGIGEHG